MNKNFKIKIGHKELREEQKSVASVKNCLIIAVKNEEVGFVRTCLNLLDKANIPPIALIFALEKRNYTISKMLLQAGANVHAEDDYALKFASKNGHYKVVQLLLEAGANVHAEDDYALIRAVVYGHYKVVQLLLKAGANVHAQYDYALEFASKYRRKFVRLLLKSAL